MKNSALATYFLENAAKKSELPQNSPLDKNLARIKAKLASFLLKPERVRQLYNPDVDSIEAQYACTIADLQEFKYKEAMQKIDALLRREPSNPHFLELKGQIYLEQGKTKEARAQFEKALKIMPSSALFKFNLAQTVLESEHSKKDLQYIETVLNQALRDFSSPYGWVLLARVYDELDKPAERGYASAKYSFEIGQMQMAKKQIFEAKKHNPDAKLLLKIDDLGHQIDAYLDENTSLPKRR